MLFNFYRQKELNRTRLLFSHAVEPAQHFELAPKLSEEDFKKESFHQDLSRLLRAAGFEVSWYVFSGGSLFFAILLTFLCSLVCTPFVLPVTFFIFLLLPYFHLDAKVRKKARIFSEDYPTVLLATASSVKAGLTPQLALKRAVDLLPEDNLLRKEVQQMLDKFGAGESKEKVIRDFPQFWNGPFKVQIR